MTIETDVQKLEPGAIVELFELDLTPFGGDLLRFHAGTNGLLANVTWNGNAYTAFPVAASGFEFTGQGQAPRPKLMVSNVAGSITALVLQYDDLVGAKITRRRTLAKYLDAVNFPARRNLLTYTDSLTEIAGGWTHGDAVSPIASGQMGPDGTLTATSFTGLSGITVSPTGTVVYKTFTVVVGLQYTISVWVNPLSTGTFAIRYGWTPDVQTALFPMTAGTGWRRVSATFTAGSLGGTSSVCLFGASGGSVNVTLADAQVEAGSAATSYQPVTGATWSQNPTADPTAEFPQDIYYIDRKSVETNEIVEFELAPAMDITGVMLPRRQIVQNICPWRYRGSECGYTGTSYFDANDASVGTLALDVCGKRLTSCKLRFGQYAELPFGGFPVAGLFR